VSLSGIGINLFREPSLDRPVLIAAWPGIGNIGLVAVNSLREAVQAELFAEIKPWDYFYPRGITIEEGVLTGMDFPTSNFYFRRTGKGDVIFFIGEEQPSGSRRAHSMSSMVLDLAEHYEVSRIYTAAAAVAPIHHSMTPRIWGVPNSSDIVSEIRRLPNTILMSDIMERQGRGNITGMNGLLMGLARERKLEGACLLGEVPVYVSQFPTIYPKSSKSIVELLSAILGIEVDLSNLDNLVVEVEDNIERLYQMIPEQMRERIEKLKYTTYLKEDTEGTITEEDKKRIMQEIDQFFSTGDKGH